jgi:cell cycle arrest protein BUB3
LRLIQLLLVSRCTDSCADALVSGSWDCSLRLWDPRAATPQQAVTTTPERVYCLDMTNHNIVVAMASRLFNIYDIRNMATPAQQRESSLKYMTRSLACMSDGQGAPPLPAHPFSPLE